MITGTVVSGLVIGLPAYVLIKVLTPNFFARKDTRTPVYTAAFSLVVTVGLNIALVPRLGVLGAGPRRIHRRVVQCRCSTSILVRRGYFRLPARIAGRADFIAALAMALALWFHGPLDPWFDGAICNVLAGSPAVTLTGALVYGIAAILLGVLDFGVAFAMLRRSDWKPRADPGRPDQSRE